MQVVKFMKLRRLAQLAHKHQNQLKYTFKYHTQYMEDTASGPDMC
jgi:hypothetical protein